MLFHQGQRFQRGRGIGAIFSGLFRSLRPLFSMGLKSGKKFLASDMAKKIGSTALEIGKDAAKNVASDILEGKNLAESLNRGLETAKSKVAAKLKGSGRRKRKSTTITNYMLKKKKKYNLLD